MPRHIRLGIFAAAVLGAAGWAATAGQAVDAPGATEAAVRGVLDRQVADWNRGDLDGFLGGYWNDPGVVFQSGGERFDGWGAMRDRYRARYVEGGKAMGRLAFEGVQVVPLGEQAALVRGGWRLEMPDGKKPGGLFTLVFRKVPAGWKIVHDHTSAETPKAGG